ncbi:MAG: acyloxyacyl hydrolase [Gammaproteobacteria bacterium]|nr:acyloxyacyl hydrolase [Gammaproteobacteria bacterium]NIR98583.1 acyloxyacyl hydrolase [Gammaproteobacteria bacterium]NIT64306.1 acyloxyacyl hydrolase [Gammaproteobacteria bacterium]NIX10934.1 acyloxyacyl hydrolase [Gammaproteobacteria bacterium]NIY32886.1 acyloxyacyl hydrolase [Gammaproteobacteria bacterium]
MLCTILAVPTRALSGMTVALGADSHSHSDVHMVRLAIRRSWQRTWLADGDWYLSGHWAFELGAWSGNEGAAGSKTLVDAGAGAVVRLRRKASAEGGAIPFVEAGTGAYILSGTTIGGRELSSALQFGSHLGAGLLFGHGRRYELGWRFLHFSNARIEKPNDGFNFNLIYFGRRF